MIASLLLALLMEPLPETDPEPAVADFPCPIRVVHVEHIEVNVTRWGNGQELRQFVWWDKSWDRHDRKWRVIDRGWIQQDNAVLIDVGGKPAAWMPSRDVIVTADEVFWTVSEFDPEIVLRDELNHIP